MDQITKPKTYKELRQAAQEKLARSLLKYGVDSPEFQARAKAMKSNDQLYAHIHDKKREARRAV